MPAASKRQQLQVVVGPNEIAMTEMLSNETSGSIIYGFFAPKTIDSVSL